MKKKLLTVVLSTVLCIGMTMTALAAPSPSVTSSSAVAVVDGQNISVSVVSGYGNNLSSAQSTVVNELQSSLATAENPEKVYMDLIKAQTSAKVDKINSMGVVDIVAPAGVDLSKGVPITFSANGINAGDQVIVLHLTAAGTWESISATAGNGTITGTFRSLSPVIYFKVSLTPNYTNTVTSAPASNDTTSPKTGETNMPIAVLVMTLLAGCGIVVYGKRRNSMNK